VSRKDILSFRLYGVS